MLKTLHKKMASMNIFESKGIISIKILTALYDNGSGRRKVIRRYIPLSVGQAFVCFYKLCIWSGSVRGLHCRGCFKIQLP